jgi:hypothetical protein
VPTCAIDHQVIDDDEPVTATNRRDRIEGALLLLRGATGSVAAIADEDAFACATSFGSVKNRAGTEASFLHPADCNDRVSDEAVSLVQV